MPLLPTLRRLARRPALWLALLLLACAPLAQAWVAPLQAVDVPFCSTGASADPVARQRAPGHHLLLVFAHAAAALDHQGPGLPAAPRQPALPTVVARSIAPRTTTLPGGWTRFARGRPRAPPSDPRLI